MSMVYMLLRQERVLYLFTVSFFVSVFLFFYFCLYMYLYSCIFFTSTDTILFPFENYTFYQSILGSLVCSLMGTKNGLCGSLKYLHLF